MATSYAQAVRHGTMSASRLHLQTGDQERIAKAGGNVDVFGTLVQLNVPLIFRPLEGLLGAFLPSPTPGVLVTTERPLSIQRFTAAHELGHFYLGHDPSLDDEKILRRMAIESGSAVDFQEVEADAFAVAFMMPRWLVAWHCEKQGWKAKDLENPYKAYQLALRMGASYEATTWTLQRYKLISPSAGAKLRGIQPREIKVRLLAEFKPANYRGDVWVITENDAGLQIDGSAIDHFVIRLREHSSGGYLWNAHELARSGLAIVSDQNVAMDQDSIGGDVWRHITTSAEGPRLGHLELAEARPWQPDEPLNQFAIAFDLTGPEIEGWSRAERNQSLSAA